LTIGERIRRRREGLGLSAADVAKMVGADDPTDTGVNRSTVLKWENGEIKYIKHNRIIALCKCLQVSPEYLLCGSEQTNNKFLAPLYKRIEIVDRESVVFNEDNYLYKIELTKEMLSKDFDYFAKKALDNSMSGSNIYKDDILVFRKPYKEQNTKVLPEHNAIGLFVFADDNLARCRKYKCINNFYLLCPECDEEDPVVLSHEDDFIYLGELVLVIHSKH